MEFAFVLHLTVLSYTKGFFPLTHTRMVVVVIKLFSPPNDSQSDQGNNYCAILCFYKDALILSRIINSEHAFTLEHVPDTAVFGFETAGSGPKIIQLREHLKIVV